MTTGNREHDREKLIKIICGSLILVAADDLLRIQIDIMI